MPLSQKQTLLKAYLLTGPAANIPWEDPEAGLENNTKTLAEWLAIPNARAINQAVHSSVVGSALGIIVDNPSASKSSIVNAVASGSEYNASTAPSLLSDIADLTGDVGDLTDATYVANIHKLLQPHEDCTAKFDALLTKPGTISEHFGGISQADIDAICAPE